MKNKLLTALFGVAVFFFIITFSIGLPIYMRFFYYLQIGPLGLEEASGLTAAEIREAYNQMLNYLTMPGFTFQTGALAHTQDFASHMADCKVLFNLNLAVLLPSSAIIIVGLILNKKGVIQLCRPLKMNVAVISSIVLLSLFILIGGLCAIDFDRAFTVFHQLFFAGKGNWQFNPYVDPVLNILPQNFFMNCAILILCGIVFISVGIIVFQVVKRIKNDKNKNV